ncbi:uncharacterized protein DNG_10072 [Cephalotrichum gorgonifer]|uniref:Uncharacterized protein n=1 Tax=Cephalotrichum gorgonifer TaxID=2041049 RepID=A0AAE8SZZ9_9PEZI|nr:uncharacterized protein DNG_10072 [Cephalotrichum gorgonifer]
MESVYRMERTSATPYGCLLPPFATAKPNARESIPPIDTSVANKPFSYDLGSPEDSPATSPTVSSAASSYPSPTTAFTTPTTSPVRNVDLLAKVGQLSNENAQMRRELDALKDEMRTLKLGMADWAKRYFAEVVRNRELKEAHGKAQEATPE